MAHLIGQIFTCLCSFLVNCSRILLFLGCLLLALIELARMNTQLVDFLPELYTPSTTSYNPFYNPVGILVFACFGAIGAFFKHSSFKVVSIVCFHYYPYCSPQRPYTNDATSFPSSFYYAFCPQCLSLYAIPKDTMLSMADLLNWNLTEVCKITIGFMKA